MISDPWLGRKLDDKHQALPNYIPNCSLSVAFVISNPWLGRKLDDKHQALPNYIPTCSMSVAFVISNPWLGRKLDDKHQALPNYIPTCSMSVAFAISDPWLSGKLDDKHQAWPNYNLMFVTNGLWHNISSFEVSQNSVKAEGGPSAFLKKNLPDEDALVSWLFFICKEVMQSYASKWMDTLQGGVTWAAY